MADHDGGGAEGEPPAAVEKEVDPSRVVINGVTMGADDIEAIGNSALRCEARIELLRRQKIRREGLLAGVPVKSALGKKSKSSTASLPGVGGHTSPEEDEILVDVEEVQKRCVGLNLQGSSDGNRVATEFRMRESTLRRKKQDLVDHLFPSGQEGEAAHPAAAATGLVSSASLESLSEIEISRIHKTIFADKDFLRKNKSKIFDGRSEIHYKKVQEMARKREDKINRAYQKRLELHSSALHRAHGESASAAAGGGEGSITATRQKQWLVLLSCNVFMGFFQRQALFYLESARQYASDRKLIRTMNALRFVYRLKKNVELQRKWRHLEKIVRVYRRLVLGLRRKSLAAERIKSLLKRSQEAAFLKNGRQTLMRRIILIQRSWREHAAFITTAVEEAFLVKFFKKETEYLLKIYRDFRAGDMFTVSNYVATVRGNVCDPEERHDVSKREFLDKWRLTPAMRQHLLRWECVERKYLASIRREQIRHALASMGKIKEYVHFWKHFGMTLAEASNALADDDDDESAEAVEEAVGGHNQKLGAQVPAEACRFEWTAEEVEEAVHMYHWIFGIIPAPHSDLYASMREKMDRLPRDGGNMTFVGFVAYCCRNYAQVFAEETSEEGSRADLFRSAKKNLGGAHTRVGAAAANAITTDRELFSMRSILGYRRHVWQKAKSSSAEVDGDADEGPAETGAGGDGDTDSLPDFESGVTSAGSGMQGSSALGMATTSAVGSLAAEGLATCVDDIENVEYPCLREYPY